MLKSKITKQVKTEFKSIIDTHGYWSKEVREYCEQFEYNISKKLHSLAHAYINHNQDFTK